MFSSVQDVCEGLRKTGYIADSVAITTVFLASSLHRPLLSQGPAGSERHNWRTPLHKLLVLLWSACSAMKASAKTKPSGSLTNRCNRHAVKDIYLYPLERNARERLCGA